MRRSTSSTLLAATLTAALAGCTGSDVLDTGNSTTRIEVVAQGSNLADYDCVNFALGEIRINPLNGHCGPTSSPELVGDPCGADAECGVGAICEGSNSKTLVPNTGILMSTGAPQGNVLGVPCAPATGFCDCNPAVPSPDPPECPSGAICTMDSECGCSADWDCVCLKSTSEQGGPFVPPTPVVLSEGLYELNLLFIDNTSLYIDNPPFLGKCGNTALDLSTALGPLLRFTVQPDEDKVVRLVLNTDALAEVLTNTTSCGALNAVLPDNEVIRCDTCDAGVAP